MTVWIEADADWWSIRRVDLFERFYVEEQKHCTPTAGKFADYHIYGEMADNHEAVHLAGPYVDAARAVAAFERLCKRLGEVEHGVIAWDTWVADPYEEGDES